MPMWPTLIDDGVTPSSVAPPVAPGEGATGADPPPVDVPPAAFLAAGVFALPAEPDAPDPAPEPEAAADPPADGLFDWAADDPPPDEPPPAPPDDASALPPTAP